MASIRASVRRTVNVGIPAAGGMTGGGIVTRVPDPATSYTLGGPAAGGVGASSSDFTVTPNGTYTGTIRITPAGGGLGTPIELTWNGSSEPRTFRITPPGQGVVTLSSTSSPQLGTDPPPLTYTAKPVVLINSAWRTANASTFGGDPNAGPWVLDLAGTYYMLTENLTATGLGFLLGASDITLDFKGYTLTYNSVGNTTIPNANFGADPLGSRSVAGWTASADVQVVADTDGPLQYPTDRHFYGPQNLKVSVSAAQSGTLSVTGGVATITATDHGLSTGDYVFLYGFSTVPVLEGVYQVSRVDANTFSISSAVFTSGSGSGTWSRAIYLESSEIVSHEVNCYYAGTLQTADWQTLSTSHSSWMEIRQGSAALAAMPSAKDQNFAISTWSDYANQTRANTTVAVCGVTSNAPIRLRLYLGNSSTLGSQDVYVGRATLTRAYTPAILVPGQYEGQLPAYDYLPQAMQSRYVASKGISAYTILSSITGGAIVQGSGLGFRSHAIQGNASYGAQTIQDLSISMSGDDACPVLAGHRGSTLSNGGPITIGGSGHGLSVTYGEVNVTRRYNINTALWVQSALQGVTISKNTVMDFPQRAIAISPTPTNTAIVTIDSNSVFGKAIVTNAYAIYCVSRSVVTNNSIDGITRPGAGCQGIYAGTGANSTLENVMVRNNRVRITTRGNREERTTSPVRAFRMRNQEAGVDSTPNAVLSAITVDGNVFESFTTTGRPARADGTRFSIINRNGSSGSGIVVTNNVCRGITGDLSQIGCGANYDAIEGGTGITLRGNTYDSNHIAVQFCSSDSPGVGVWGVDFTGETFTKNTSYPGAANVTFVGIDAGQFFGPVGNVRILSPVIGAGASLSPTFWGSVSKSISVGYRISARVRRQSDSTPIPGATVQVQNAAMRVDAMGTTGAGGVVADLPAVVLTYSGTTTALVTSYSPHALAVSANGFSSAVVNLGLLTSDQSISVEMS